MDRLGARSLIEVQRAFAHILQNPNGFQRVHDQFRQAPLDRFPFVIVYRTDGPVVVVMRVFHTSQHPKKKVRRKK